MPHRLFVTGDHDQIKFCTALDIKQARRKIGKDARIPSDDDCRYVWLIGKLYTMSADQLRKKYNVSRQGAANWRLRGGADLPTWTEHQIRTKVAAVHQALSEGNRLAANKIAKAVGASPRMVQELAGRLEIKLQGRRRMPEDAELIELQKGCTWVEFAAKTGMQIATLRNYIYKRPALAEALRKVRKPAVTGPKSHGTFPKEKVRELHLKGVTAHRIAEQLHLEQMTVRYWIKRWDKEAADAKAAKKASHKREAGAVVGGSDGGDQHVKR